MFGYLTPYKPEMKFKEFEAYKTIYCALCKELSEKINPLFKFTLSYDFAFMAMLFTALTEKEHTITKSRCRANPLKKCNYINENKALTYTAYCAASLIYLKNKDDIEDKKFPANFMNHLLNPYFAMGNKKSLSHYPKVCEKLSRLTQNQSVSEKDKTLSIDGYADNSAKILVVMAEEFFLDNLDPALSRFCYLLGRYIYFCDAYDDLQSDKKKGEFNPFLRAEKEETAYFEKLINTTIGEIINSYEKLSFYNFKDVLDNFIYFGLVGRAQQLIKKEGKDNNERSI